MPNKSITIETTIRLPLERVWEIFTEPGHIVNWYFASPQWHAPEAENDLKPGGKFRTKMAARDGSMAFDFEGVYTVVEPYRKIAFNLGDTRKVEIIFSHENGDTKITESFDLESENSEELQRNGWQAILNNFKNYAETSD